MLYICVMVVMRKDTKSKEKRKTLQKLEQCWTGPRMHPVPVRGPTAAGLLQVVWHGSATAWLLDTEQISQKSGDFFVHLGMYKKVIKGILHGGNFVHVGQTKPNDKGVLKISRGHYRAILQCPCMRPLKYVNFCQVWRVCKVLWVFEHV